MPSLQDAAKIPENGFLADGDDTFQINLLPTPRDVVEGLLRQTLTTPALEPIDAQRTIQNLYQKARLILYETA